MRRSFYAHSGLYAQTHTHSKINGVNSLRVDAEQKKRVCIISAEEFVPKTFTHFSGFSDHEGRKIHRIIFGRKLFTQSGFNTII